MDDIKVTKRAVKPIVDATFPDYRGRKFRVSFTKTVTFYDTNWGGGTRNTYRAVRMDGGQANELPSFWPWANPVEGQTVELPADVVVVEHTIYCGQDLGLRFYAHPSRNLLLTAGGK
jgi:hypothetical protein